LRSRIQHIDTQPVPRTTKLIPIPRTRKIAVARRRRDGARGEGIAAVAFAAVFGSEIERGGAEGGAELECHAVGCGCGGG
jgi:hypothetical protein